MFPLCLSIPALPLPQVRQLVEKSDMAEIRLDLLRPTVQNVQELFAIHGKKMIATCRTGFHEEIERIALLKTAIDFGCAYVDLEIDAPITFLQYLIPYAKAKGCKLILSYHNYIDTPSRDSLGETILGAFRCGADIVKIVTMVHDFQDLRLLLGLYEHSFHNLIIIGMGDEGKISRLAAAFLGAPFTYVSPDGVEATAPGQFSESEMRELLRKMQ
ncbi:MAG: type I 3-dehydroquinate dehydratase [Bacteroidales bacterium]|nr:type I 3-dehydroquinate dehydratase [Bacteroidales bacterium]